MSLVTPTPELGFAVTSLITTPETINTVFETKSPPHPSLGSVILETPDDVAVTPHSHSLSL